MSGTAGKHPDEGPHRKKTPDTPAVRRKAPDMSRSRSPRSEKPARAVAPWVRTRLRTAPWAAASLAALVLATVYLAAALPRAVDAYETEGLRHDIRTAAPRNSVLELTAEPPGLELDLPVREAGLAPAVLRKQRDEARALLPEPLRTDPEQTVHGLRTVKRVDGLDPWLPRPDGISPELVLSSPSGLTEHTALREGRLPTGTARAPEAVVTVKTAEALRLKPGSVVHVPGRVSAEPIALTVTGIVEPRSPESPYWAVEPLLRTPVLAPWSATRSSTTGREPCCSPPPRHRRFSPPPVSRRSSSGTCPPSGTSPGGTPTGSARRSTRQPAAPIWSGCARSWDPPAP